MISKILRKIIPEKLRPIGYLTQLVRSRTGWQVINGPFKGLKYISHSVGSVYIPKLLGIYERELNPCVERICATQPQLIIDVGTAEGYYCIGLAVRNPEARLVGFEMDTLGREALGKMAALNNVSERLEIRGKCEPADLNQALGDDPAPVVVCDVEGYEEILLDPTAVPALRRASILVELHDFVIPQLTELLVARFKDTHHIEHIWQEPRARADFPYSTLYTSLLPKSYIDWAVSETRPVRMAWLWMTPN